MKLSLSTYGWRDTPWQEYEALARELHYDGIEIHDVKEARISGQGAPFEPSSLSRTRRRLAGEGIEISCLDALSNPADAAQYDKAVREGEDLIVMAAALHCQCLRLRALSTGADEALEELRDLDVAYSRNATEIFDSQKIVLIDDQLTKQAGQGKKNEDGTIDTIRPYEK